MKHKVAHQLGQEGAKKVAVAAWESYSKRFASYSPTLTWASDTRGEIGFSVKGISLKGWLDVTPTSIDLELKVPFLMKPFQGKAIAVIEEEIKSWIAKSEAGEL